MRIVFAARQENAGVIKALLGRGHEVLIPDGQAASFQSIGLAVRPITLPSDPNTARSYQGLSMQDKVSCITNIAHQVIDSITAVKPDAVVVWTDAPPLPRIMVLAAKARGIPTFEVTHGSFNTYRQGHFECESYVDYVLAPGQEEVDFRAFYGGKAKVIVTGKPTYDWIPMADRDTCRAALDIPAKRPVILYGMTWRHPFSTWERDRDLGDSEVFNAHKMLLSVCRPYLIIKPHPVMANMTERLRAQCDEAGMTDYAVTNMPVHAILPACDLVISHKSSLLVESVLCDIPAIGFSFREWNDHRFNAGRGIEWVEKRDDLLGCMARCILDHATKERLADERTAAKHYYNGPNDGHATERMVSTIEKLTTSRMEVCA